MVLPIMYTNILAGVDSADRKLLEMAKVFRVGPLRTAGSVYLNARKTLKAPGTIKTAPYPGFPTDAQPPLRALCATLPGTTIFVETIFENRYRHVSELIRLGAKINTEGRVAVVEGVNRLTGAELEACDLRGGAAMVTAALFAEGITKIGKTCYIERGYENIEGALRSVGADIRTG